MTSLQKRNKQTMLYVCCREKLEREIHEKMEEKRREQALKMRESLIGRNPAWKALRSATRYDSFKIRLYR